MSHPEVPATDRRRSFVGQPIDDPLVRLVAKYPAVVLALVSSTVVVLEVLEAARGQVATALAIVDTAPLASVVIGIAVVLAPLLVTPAAVAVLLWYHAERQAGRRALALLFLSAALWLVAADIAPLLLVVIYLGVTIVGESLRWYRLRGYQQRGVVVVTERLEVSFGLTFLLLILTVLISGRPWLPEERVSLAGGSTVVGYVLDSAGAWVSVLTEPGRLVVRLEATAVTSRTICQVAGGFLGPTLSEVLRPPTSLPDC